MFDSTASRESSQNVGGRSNESLFHCYLKQYVTTMAHGSQVMQSEKMRSTCEGYILFRQLLAVVAGVAFDPLQLTMKFFKGSERRENNLFDVNLQTHIYPAPSVILHH